jgi:hypothetical protein
MVITVTIFLVGYTPKTITKIETRYEIVEVDRIIVQTQLVQLTPQQRENIRIIIESEVTIRLENELNHKIYALEDDYDTRLATAIDNLIPIVKWRDKIIKETIYIEKIHYVNTTSTVYQDVIVEVENHDRIDELTSTLESLSTEYSEYVEEHRFTNTQFQDTANGLMVVITRLQTEIAELK